jgi:hypothetical protein
MNNLSGTKYSDKDKDKRFEDDKSDVSAITKGAN